MFEETILGPFNIDQGHYTEVTQGDIFLEQKMSFGLVWAGRQY